MQSVNIGPNDHHIASDNGTLRSMPGLGADQPKPQVLRDAQIEGEAKMAGLKAQLAAAANDLSEREARLAALEAEQDMRQRQLEAREAALAAAGTAGKTK